LRLSEAALADRAFYLVTSSGRDQCARFVNRQIEALSKPRDFRLGNVT
jgi:hypothetical protein